MLLFQDNQCIDICLKNQNPYVRLAVEDLRTAVETGAVHKKCGQAVDVLESWAVDAAERWLEDSSEGDKPANS